MLSEAKHLYTEPNHSVAVNAGKCTCLGAQEILRASHVITMTTPETGAGLRLSRINMNLHPLDNDETYNA